MLLAEPGHSEEVLGAGRSWRGWVRECVKRDKDNQRYGLRLDEHWGDKPSSAPVVVLLHGFNSTPERSERLIAGARESGLPCGVFAYPNDQPIAMSSQLLSAQLKSFAKRCPQRRVALVAHSMGGLVARDCIESDALDPGNVERLIMVAPPTHGSSLANYAVGLDLWEHWFNRRDGSPWRRLRDGVIDGLSEAPADLRPGSAFLTRLNSRPRRKGVKYTLLLGNKARVSESQRYMVRKTLCLASSYTPGCPAEPDDVDQAIAKLDEVIDGRGDGAVAVRRGRLRGVADTHVLPFDHLAVLRDPDDLGVQQAHGLILARLKASGGD